MGKNRPGKLFKENRNNKKYRLSGIYFLDEPEAESQFIIATHSPILLGIPGADIWNFDDGIIHKCEYEETDSYQVTEMFINNRKQLLDRLLR